jgi:Ca-activated chloride channel family protein
VQVNLATARARQGKPPAAWEGPLARLGETAGRAGVAARYNLGTLFGERKDYDRALAELRRALERDPNDADARWNYELLARDREAAKRKQEQRPKDPRQEKQQKSESGQGSQGEQGQPPPQPQGGGAQQQPPPAQVPQPASGGAAPGMTTQQAEQLLGSLQELERLERQHARRAKVTGERKGKDW